MHALKHFDQQLYPRHFPYVAGNHRAIYSLLVRLQLICLELLVGNLLEGYVYQVLARLLPMLGKTLTEVVERAQIKIRPTQVTIA